MTEIMHTGMVAMFDCIRQTKKVINSINLDNHLDTAAIGKANKYEYQISYGIGTYFDMIVGDTKWQHHGRILKWDLFDSGEEDESLNSKKILQNLFASKVLDSRYVTSILSELVRNAINFDNDWSDWSIKMYPQTTSYVAPSDQDDQDSDGSDESVGSVGSNGSSLIIDNYHDMCETAGASRYDPEAIELDITDIVKEYCVGYSIIKQIDTMMEHYEDIYAIDRLCTEYVRTDVHELLSNDDNAGKLNLIDFAKADTFRWSHIHWTESIAKQLFNVPDFEGDVVICFEHKYDALHTVDVKLAPAELTEQEQYEYMLDVLVIPQDANQFWPHLV